MGLDLTKSTEHNRKESSLTKRLVAIDPDTKAVLQRRSNPEIPDVRTLVRLAPPELVGPRSALSKGLEAAFIGFLQSKSAPVSAVPVERRVFLTVAEAQEFSGLPAVFLRRLIASGKLRALRTGAGWRVPRVELERLSEALTAPEETARQLSEHELRDIELNSRRRRGQI